MQGGSLGSLLLAAQIVFGWEEKFLQTLRQRRAHGESLEEQSITAGSSGSLQAQEAPDVDPGFYEAAHALSDRDLWSDLGDIRDV